MNFEIKNKALTSIKIKNFENGLQFKPYVHHWCSLTDTRVQISTINGKTTSSVRKTSGRIVQSTYKLSWLSIGYFIILHGVYRNWSCQLKPIDIHTLHFCLKISVAKQTKPDVQPAMRQQQYEDEHMTFQFLHPSKNPLYYLVFSMHTSLSQTAFKYYYLHTPARLCQLFF